MVTKKEKEMKSITEEPVNNACDFCRLVPLSQLDLDPPTEGWPAVIRRKGYEILTDDLGRPAIVRSLAAQLHRERAEHKAKLEAQQQRKLERARPRSAVRGAPAVEGATPFESLIRAESAAGSYSTPKDEFGPGWGSPTMELMEEQFAAGAEAMSKRRQRAEARAKERLAAQMKDDLGGNR